MSTPTASKEGTRSPRVADVYPGLLDASRGDGAILGVNAFGHDASVALVSGRDGRVLYAVAEERLSNCKHDWHYPIGAIHACCREAERLGMRLEGVAVPFKAEEFMTKTLFREIEVICQDARESQRLQRGLLELYERGEYFSPVESSETAEGMAELLRESSLGEEQLELVTLRCTWYFNWAIKYRKLKGELLAHFEGFPIEFVGHHDAHAASAFYGSGFESSAVLVIDGSGESDTVTVYRGDGEGLHRVRETGWPHSLGIFYLFATQQLGFGLGDEYKVMGMSAYGKPRFASLLEGALRVSSDGKLEICNTEYVEVKGLGELGHIAVQFTDAFHAILPVRTKDQALTQVHFDFAASVQQLTEEMGVQLANASLGVTGEKRLALAGGVGLNGLMNEAIRRRSGCEDLFVYPAAADDGTAVGAAQYWLFARGAHRSSVPPTRPARLRACYFGHCVTDQEAERSLVRLAIRYTQPGSIYEAIADALMQGKIVARCVDRAEFGPRALGHRSILAHPGLANMKDTLNLRVKHREEFRPFAPACRRERVGEYFDVHEEAPFMLLIGRAREGVQARIPSVVHADGTARVQSVDAAENVDFYRVISAFEAKSGLPLVINTSFNVNGETIVNTAQDAIESFGFMDIDYLALGPYWISKEENLDRFPSYGHDEYLQIRKDRYAAGQYGHLSQIDVSQFDASFLQGRAAVAQFVRRAMGRASVLHGA